MLIMTESTHARESRKDGSRKMNLQKARTGEGSTFREFSLWQARKNGSTLRRRELNPCTDQHTDEEYTGPMAPSEEAKQWLTEHGLEGFLRIADAPPHDEPEQAAKTIDLSEITEGAVQALTGLQAGGMQSVECPSNEILFEYFGEYSLSSKAYRTQGGQNLLFGEVARVLMEYGFVHPRPPAIPKYRAGFVIAAYEGLRVDWLHFITEGLKDAIGNLVEGKKPWAGIAQWLTVLVPPVLPIKQKKRGRQETTPKKATKRRQLLEKHTPGWTQEEQQEEGPSSRKPEPAVKGTEKPADKGNEKATGKGKDKVGKKTTRAREPAEREPVVQKPIRITLRRPEPEPEDFVQKIRLVTTTEEEAEEEEPTETLERHAPKRRQEQRAKEPAPPVGDTQQRAKEPTPIAVGLEEREEPRAAQNEAAPDQTWPDFGQEQVLPDFDSEQVFPDLGSEQVPAPETSARQPEKRQEQQPEPPSGSTQSTPTEEGEQGQEKSTCQQWLRWLSEQVSGVADQLDVEEKRREHLTRTTTEELVSLRTQIRGMQEELTRAKESMANTAKPGQQSGVATESVGATRTKATPEPEPEPVRGEALRTDTETAKEIKTLREELAVQEALREKEKEQRRLVEDERRRIEEGLRRSQANNDRLKEERDKLQQEKDRLRRHAETEIERLKEELRQQKDRDDRLRAQVNRRLKQKTDDYDRLYREHKQAESDHKKRSVEFDRQLEKVKEQLKETRLDLAKTVDELDKKKEALSAEKTESMTRLKQLEAAAKEKLELTKKKNEEAERATYALNKLQETYQKKVVEYECHAQAAAGVILRLRQEKQEAHARAQIGVDRIRLIMSAWRDRAQTSINECSEKVWKEWSQQAAELQLLRADAENRTKEGDKFYKLDEESIVTIREELSEDFFALAEEHLKEVRGLVERLDDGQLETQLQLERYEQDRQQQEAEGKTTPITISDEERPAEERPTESEEPRQARTEEVTPTPSNKESTAIAEEQRQENAEAMEDEAATQPVDDGGNNTGSSQEPGTGEEQREPEGGAREEPVQQTPRPEADKEAGPEQSLDSFEQSLLDILDEE